jgi:hypothetical protein
MKRLLAGLVGSTLLGAGLVAVATSDATADPYPGTVFTACDIGGRANVPNKDPRPRSEAHIKSAGSGQPKGKLKIQYIKIGGGYRSSQTVSYDSKSVRFRGPRIKPLGRYKARMKYLPKAGSVWKSCNDTYYFTRVKKK